MEIVLAALGDQGRIRNLGTVDGIILRGLDLELGNCVRVRHGAGRIGAVQAVSAGVGVAVHIDTPGAPSQGSGIVHVGGRT